MKTEKDAIGQTHTPGPWTVAAGPSRKNGHNGIAVEARERHGRGQSIFEASCGSAVSCPHTVAWLPADSYTHSEADARLIAAAPDMLAALKRVRLGMAHRNGDCYSDDYQGACVCGVEQVDAAILRAEGN